MVCSNETAMDNGNLASFPMEAVSCRSRPWELKETARCMFCGGASCKRCSEKAYLHATAPAIEKFHCNWITDEIMAMQRPADELFDSIDLLGKFKSCKITAVLNLTEPGEHPFCGFALKPSGFPYSPERLMAVGIKHFNFAWRDMTAPSISLTQNIVRVGMAELLEGGKVAIHCHAGFGRTGIVVACLAMARTGMPSDEAVQLVRSKRPGSVQTNAQLSFIQQFEREYLFQKSVYPIIDTDSITKSREENPMDLFPTVILAKPPSGRKSTLTESINRRFSFRKPSERILPATPKSQNNLMATPSSRFTTPRISPSSSSRSSSSNSPIPLYVHLKTIDMSIIDEKLCNIEHSHPHHELSSRQLSDRQPIVPTDTNYYNQYSSILLQLLLKLFRSISQSHHPLYLCALLCGYSNDQMSQRISNSLQNNESIPWAPLPFNPLTQSELLELRQNISRYRALTNQNNWKEVSEVSFTNSLENTLKNEDSLPVLQNCNEEIKSAAESTTQFTELSLHPVNSLMLTSLLFDWIDSRDDCLFTSKFLESLRQHLRPPLTSSASTLPIVATFHYFVSPSLLPPREVKGSSTGDKPASNQVLPATIGTSSVDAQNLLDLMLRKHLSRTKLSLLEDLLTLFHQFDNLSDDLFQRYYHLIFAMEMRIALSCLEETHQSLLSQYIVNEIDTNLNPDLILRKDPSGENIIEEETTLLSLLCSPRQMNMVTIATLLSSGVILVSNPSIISKNEQKNERDVLSMTPAMYQLLSDLLQVINIFHTLIGMNWVSSNRSGQKLIRWRRSFAEGKGGTLDKDKGSAEDSGDVPKANPSPTDS